ncbi:uncharacterized protein J3D65DRAFT_119427 [Phyllosticta citribraziliensis]|uniref:Uncharacterized protein n=1 Tax=Phyllosticta citribraziliensis TaxID=989973 RepID=A0ABR1L8L9_9PEZI
MTAPSMVREKGSRAYVRAIFKSCRWVCGRCKGSTCTWASCLSTCLATHRRIRNLQPLDWPCGMLDTSEQPTMRCDVPREKEQEEGHQEEEEAGHHSKQTDTPDERFVLIHPAARGVVATLGYSQPGASNVRKTGRWFGRGLSTTCFWSDGLWHEEGS